jgi:hypothetical protein
MLVENIMLYLIFIIKWFNFLEICRETEWYVLLVLSAEISKVVSYHLVGPWWLTPVTPATQQAETRRMAV